MNADRDRSGRQLTLALPHQPAHGRADFLVGDSNRAALALIESWPDWPSRVVLLAGPSGSGKTHLTAIWRDISGATVLQAAELATADEELLLRAGALALEDIDAGIDEAALFHILNLARERDTTVLLTARAPPTAMDLGLPDLVSRLRAAQPLMLSEPDDDLLTKVLVKLFADRQLTVDRPLIDFIVRRAERSLAAANALVQHLDQASLAAKGPVNRSLVQELLLGLDPESENPADSRG